MAEKLLPFLMPTYYRKFSCIGNACEDTCCKNWGVIFIDKATYMKMKNVRTAGLSKEFVEKMSFFDRIKHDADVSDIIKKEQYAKIELIGGNGYCPMLNENMLCDVYINLGVEYMSKTCKMFPRLINIYDGAIGDTHNFEASLSCSCHEVVRKAIYNEEGIDFEYAELPQTEAKLYSAIASFANESYCNTYKRYFTEIRNFMIDILQCRTYSMDDRMVILGIFCNKINNSPIDEIPNVIEAYSGLLNMGAFAEHLSRLDTGEEARNTIMSAIVKSFGVIGENFEIVREMRTDVSEVLEKNGSINYENLKIFIEKNEYMLENYMVNYVFSDMSLHLKIDNMWDAYVAISVIYAYLKYVLAAITTKYPELEIQKLTDTFVAIDKVLAHNLGTVVGIINVIKASPVNSLGALVTIIKN